MESRVIHGEAFQELKKLDSESISLCLTDPPYNIGLSYKDYSDDMKEKDFWNWIETIYSEIFRVLENKKHLVFTCSQKQIWSYRPLLEKIGFTFRHLSIWHNPLRKAGSYPGQWPFAWEAIMNFTKGGFTKLNNKNGIGFMDVWVEPPPIGIKHPARRPVKCWTDLVALASNEGDTILDPFLGSGTTAVAAKSLGRKYIGIEQSKEYIDIASSRLQGVGGGDSDLAS